MTMKKSLLAAAACACLAAPGFALAQTQPTTPPGQTSPTQTQPSGRDGGGWWGGNQDPAMQSNVMLFGNPVYGRIEGGWSWSTDNLRARDRGPGLVPLGGFTGDADDTFNLGVGAGLNAWGWLRSELMINHRRELDVNGVSPGGVALDANISNWNVMLNGYLNVPIRFLGLQPYVGAGVGWARNIVDTVTYNTPGGPLRAPGGSDDYLAWSLMAGVGFSFTPGMVLDIGYRYADLGRYRSDAAVTPAGTITSGIQGDVEVHEALIALRFSF